MDLKNIQTMLDELITGDSANRLDAEIALRPELAGLRFFDAPLIGCAAADDPLFAQMKADPAIIGPMFLTPEEWLPGAKSVVSVFFPKTEEVRQSNREGDLPSAQWLHARIEGQDFIRRAIDAITAQLRAEGFRTVVPQYDKRFALHVNNSAPALPHCVTTWSERHAAFAAGLGTFALSKHIITEKGVCGRFGSFITDAVFSVTPRAYTDPYEYCNFCGACVPRCPVQAISLDGGKNVPVCKTRLDGLKPRFAPRYGCAKCQVRVPCESSRPTKK